MLDVHHNVAISDVGALALVRAVENNAILKYAGPEPAACCHGGCALS